MRRWTGNHRFVGEYLDTYTNDVGEKNTHPERGIKIGKDSRGIKMEPDFELDNICPNCKEEMIIPFGGDYAHCKECGKTFRIEYEINLVT